MLNAAICWKYSKLFLLIAYRPRSGLMFITARSVVLVHICGAGRVASLCKYPIHRPTTWPFRALPIGSSLREAIDVGSLRDPKSAVVIAFGKCNQPNFTRSQCPEGRKCTRGGKFAEGEKTKIIAPMTAFGKCNRTAFAGRQCLEAQKMHAGEKFAEGEKTDNAHFTKSFIHE
jgi:hypothetical protein